MDLLNQKVVHKSFGDGTIIAFDGKYYTVEFTDGQRRPFMLTAFEKFLTLSDPVIASQVADEIRAVKAAEEAAKAAEEEAIRLAEEARLANQKRSPIVDNKEPQRSAERNSSRKKPLHVRVNTISGERIIVCNGAWMVNYDLYTNGDAPRDGGLYVEQSGNAHEKINFHVWDDGIVRGFVQAQGVHPNEGGQVHIERIDGSKNTRSEEVDDVTVVFCARNPDLGKNTVIGWYRNATVMRRGKTCPNAENDYLPYICYTAKENTHLLDVKDRTFIIPRARNGECGMGQSNLWFIDTIEAQEFRSKLINYIEQNS